MLRRHTMCEYCDGRERSFYAEDADEHYLIVYLSGDGLCFDWSVFGDGDGCDTVHIGFCPFCGRKLTME